MVVTHVYVLTGNRSAGPMRHTAASFLVGIAGTVPFHAKTNPEGPHVSL